MLLKNHGAVALGASVESALDRLETIEQFARVVFTARLLGRVETLAPADVSRLLGMAQRPGAPRDPWRCEDCRGCRECERGAGRPPGAPHAHAADTVAARAPDVAAVRAPESAAAREQLVERVADLVRRRLAE
jgi:hypothetical protein